VCPKRRKRRRLMCQMIEHANSYRYYYYYGSRSAWESELAAGCRRALIE